MIAEYDKERLSNRIRGIRGEVHISADIRVSDFITEGAVYVTVTESSLYERICQYAFQYGEDLQGMFKNEKYEYMSCFVRDVAAFRTEFEKEEILKPLFSHDKGETVAFVISFPEMYNHHEEFVRNEFIKIIQNHVMTLDDNLWHHFMKEMIKNTRTGTGINLITGEPIYPEDIDPEEELAMLLAFSRKTLVRMNVSDSFQSDSYVNQLIIQARKIGEINNQDVWFNIHGFYFCWNVSTKFFLACCLTGRQNLSLFI